MVAGLARRHERGDRDRRGCPGVLARERPGFRRGDRPAVPARDLYRHARARGPRQRPDPPEARCGAAFLADGTGDLHRALTAREHFQGRGHAARPPLGPVPARHLRSGSRRPPGGMDGRASLELPGAGGKLRRVLAQVQPYAEGALPEDIGPDLVGLIEVARHGKAGCPGDALLARLGPPWSDPNMPASEFQAAVAWAEKVERLLDILGPPRSASRACAITWSSSSNARPGPSPRADASRKDSGLRAGSRAGDQGHGGAQSARRAWRSRRTAGDRARLDRRQPRSARLWKSGLGRAQGWCAWQAAAQNARAAAASLR